MKRYADAYVAFLAHFHGTRDYFECHELLEAHWKAEADPRLKQIWHGLIQVAVAMYHERRGNREGACKLLAAAALRLHDAGVRQAGLDGEELARLLKERIALVESGKEEGELVFNDMSLPIQDEELLRESRKLCRLWGYEWSRPSPLEEAELVHKHLLRDRTEVVEERARRQREKRSPQ